MDHLQTALLAFVCSVVGGLIALLLMRWANSTVHSHYIDSTLPDSMRQEPIKVVYVQKNMDTQHWMTWEGYLGNTTLDTEWNVIGSAHPSLPEALTHAHEVYRDETGYPFPVIKLDTPWSNTPSPSPVLQH